MERPRVIVHVDLDAFYVSVEVRDRPELKGLPVIVGGRGRGVVLTASYEARKFGLRSAMPMSRALRMCPDVVVVPPRHSVYAAESERFFDILSRYSPLVQAISVDEAFLDLTGTEALLGPPGQAVARLRQEVRDTLGITCSAGICPVKFAAKIASDVAKPNGQLEVTADRLVEFLDPLPVGRMFGVGPKTEAALHAARLRTVRDIRLAPLSLVARAVGEGEARFLQAQSRGEDERAVVPDREAKSVGAEETFEEDIDDLEIIETYLLGHAERVAARLRRAGVAAGGVTLKYKLDDFRLVTRQSVLAEPTSDGRVLHAEVCALLRRNVPPRPIRLCGVSAHALGPPPAPGLFDAQARRRDKLNAALDSVREKFGAKALTRARLLELEDEGPPPRRK